MVNFTKGKNLKWTINKLAQGNSRFILFLKFFFHSQRVASSQITLCKYFWETPTKKIKLTENIPVGAFQDSPLGAIRDPWE